MHKEYYKPNTQFFVVYAIHERDNIYDPFKIVTIENITLGLYDFLKEKEEKREWSTNGEIALELLKGLKNYFVKDSSLTYVSLINWYEIC